MRLPKITVIIPTVDGREDHLARCVDSYTNHARDSYQLELLVERDYPSCGAGWQAGVEKCRGDYIHFTCDDIEARAGWAGPAIEAIARGYHPAPQVYGPTGQPQSLPVINFVAPDWTPVHMSALPFVSRELLGRVVPLFTAHYFTDNFICDRAGLECRLRTGYSFTHHWAMVKRGAGMATDAERMDRDQKLYAEATRMVRAGEWTAPWPPNGGRP